MHNCPLTRVFPFFLSFFQFLEDEDEDEDEDEEEGTTKHQKAGMPPTTIGQQLGNKVRSKLWGLAPWVTRVQQMSVPLAKLDDEADALDESLKKHQLAFPNVVIGMYAYTAQKPNADGKNKTHFRGTPAMNFWVPESTVLQEALTSAIKPTKNEKDKPNCIIGAQTSFREWMATLEDPETKKKPKSGCKGSARHHSKKELNVPNAKSHLGQAMCLVTQRKKRALAKQAKGSSKKKVKTSTNKGSSKK